MYRYPLENWIHVPMNVSLRPFDGHNNEFSQLMGEKKRGENSKTLYCEIQLGKDVVCDTKVK